MDNKWMYRHIAILTTILTIILFPYLLLFWTGVITPFINSFGVDKAGRIYVGDQNDIRVYEDGKLVDRIRLGMMGDAYGFTVNSDDHILMATTSNIYIMDLAGNTLEKQENVGSEMLKKLEHQRRFVSESGDEYRLVGYLGWSRIVKNETETVFKISFLSFAYKLMIPLGVVGFVLYLAFAVKSHRNGTKTQFSE